MERIKLNYLILLMMVLNTISATAYDFEVDGIYYNIKGSEAEVTYEGYYYESTGKRSFREDEDFYYNDYTGHVTIPSTVTYEGVTYLVTGIGDFAFSERACGAVSGYPVGSVTSVTIPNTVTSIGFRAFEYCQYLTSITIPNSIVAIGEDAFKGSAWYGNQPNGLVYAGLVAYKYKGSMPDGTHISLNQGTKGIAGSAFKGCSGLTTIDIPSSVVYIDNNAFSNCNSLKTINIPTFVAHIGEDAFLNCSNLTSISVASGNPHYDSRDNCNAIIETATNTLIAGCQNTMIPYTVTSIYNNSFYGCSGLSNISIPNSIKTIGDAAFYNCTGLTSISMGNSVETIGSNAFRNCSSLISVTISESVTSIGTDAFRNCTALRILNYNAVSCGDFMHHQDQWGDVWSYFAPFYNLNITTINIGEQVQRIPDYFAYCLAQLLRVTIPNSVKTIGYRAFYGCSSITNIVIGNSVTDIGVSAFNGCSGLTSVTIPNTVTSIGNSAFNGCSGITSITIPNSVTTIGIAAFNGCTSLATLNFNADSCADFSSAYYEDGVTYYPPFHGLNISNLIIGNSVQRIPAYFAEYVKNLTSVAIPNSVTSIGSSAFQGCSGMTSVTIGNSVTSIGHEAFSGCSGLTSVTIGNSVTSIGGSAFQGCSGLTNLVWNAIDCSSNGNMSTSNIELVTIGNEVKVLPSSFVSGSKILSVTIPNSVTSIGSSAFYGCSQLTRVDISDLTKWCKINFGSATANPLYCAQHLYLDDAEVTDLVIPDDVETIGDYAFYNCSLTSVRLHQSLASVGNQAFNNSPAIETVTCESTTPPSWNDIAMFTTNVYNHTPLFVPRGCAGAYMSDQCWGQFAKIVSKGDINMDGNISISDVTTLINMLLSGDTSPAADVNGDGCINISDVTALINLLLSGGITGI